jgi:hypothetical protein
MRKGIWSATTEFGLIIFLIYSSLLMKEFTHSSSRPERGLAWAMDEILTSSNLAIALVVGLMGCIVIEFLRKRS